MNINKNNSYVNCIYTIVTNLGNINKLCLVDMYK